MNLNITEQHNADFQFDGNYDGRVDHWTYGPMQGAYAGDCDDYALTEPARQLGSPEAATEAFRTGRAKIHHVEIWNATRETWQGHAVLELDGQFIDSSDRAWRPVMLSGKYTSRFSFTYDFPTIERKMRGESEKSKVGLIVVAVAVLCGVAYFYGAG